MAKTGRPPIEFSDKDRLTVELLTAFGTPMADVATEIGCSVSTLQRHFQVEMDKAHARANAKVARSLFQKTQGADSELGAIVWWEKTRSGMTDKIALDHSGGFVVNLTKDESEL